MAKIEGLRVTNYRVLKDVTLGKLWKARRAIRLTPVTAFIGSNGVSKSCLFAAFGFLADSLKLGVEEACDTRGRGGFNRIRSQGSAGSIGFEIFFLQGAGTRPITYELDIDADGTRRPCVARDRLRQGREGQKYGRPFSFLMMNNGRGVAWKGDAQRQQVDADENTELELEELLNGPWALNTMFSFDDVMSGLRDLVGSENAPNHPGLLRPCECFAAFSSTLVLRSPA